ncbi:hypothetical protein [Paractinoplanes atraurantiacus]|uniref:Uncharacterized protein n=1 Tax=Paractinoplanes atraurantiacus TaxID=1036182 RepID=A0A285HZN6_9ACTN|nr:hypothetical protein [Actinoplanes atraurantiacus]SNY40276.1 hypothetical protein SAMN05421748_10615 [Actinoplanes atraurantiacus]
MEISSGGTAGPRLTDEVAVLDDNVYGSLPGTLSARSIAESLVGSGWRARASSWTAFEVEQEWIRIELQQQPEAVLFSGVVEPSRLDDPADTFARLGLSYSIELWNPEGTEPIRELRS